MSADRNVRSDLIFSHIKVVGWIYVEDGILKKAFPPTKITKFSDRLRTTVVTVYGSCSSPTSVKVNHRHLFSDTFRFSYGDFSDPFPSVPVGDYLKKAHRSDPNTYFDLPGGLNYDGCIMLSVPLCLPLTACALIEEGPIADDNITDLLVQHHPVAGEWAILMAEDQIVDPLFLDDR